MTIDKFGRSLTTSGKQHSSSGFFLLTASGDLDVQHKRLCNLRKPTESNDAVNKLYLEERLWQSLEPLRSELREKIMHWNHTVRTLEAQFATLDKKLSSEQLQKAILLIQNDMQAANHGQSLSPKRLSVTSPLRPYPLSPHQSTLRSFPPSPHQINKNKN